MERTSPGSSTTPSRTLRRCPIERILGALPAGWTRHEFAALAVPRDHRGALFLRLDGSDYRPGLWQQVRPAGDVTPAGVSTED